MNKCVFLDRDGVINIERGTYTWEPEDFTLIPGTREALRKLKDHGFYLVVITNQSGISRGLFTKQQMEACHHYMMDQTDHLIDDIYYSSYHPDYSNSLLRKPGTLMFEKAMAKYDLIPYRSWMVGNSPRDMIPAKKLGIKTIFIGNRPDEVDVDYHTEDLRSATDYIIDNQ